MDTGKRQHLQDIYATDQSSSDEFTPQVSKNILDERKRDIRRHQFTNTILGLSVLGLLIALIYINARANSAFQKVAPSPTPITQEYIPRWSLKAESQWVLDFNRKSYGSPKWTGEGDRPFSAE